MNNKIKLAVAGAVLSAASVANAGIVIPAGDWTLDVNGNVNAFVNFSDMDKGKARNNIPAANGRLAGVEDLDGEGSTVGINTGLLPAWLGFTGTTRQNDVDVSFTISFQPNVSDNTAAGDNKTPLNRQNYQRSKQINLKLLFEHCWSFYLPLDVHIDFYAKTSCNHLFFA